GWQGGLLAMVAIFLPAFLLIAGTLPFWQEMRHLPKMRGAVLGINAAVVGILAAALYQPIWTSSITAAIDVALVAILFVMLKSWNVPPWVVVITGALCGWGVSLIG
ncbi:chromate transporter, partial [Bacillaceae bacterium SIJ1]|uniref:chromate transporter n=1 Tax=Litoribacterium kuwaitense TaxID=1398745 RepID=UPI001BAC33DA